MRKTTFLGREAHLRIETASEMLTVELLDPTEAQVRMDDTAVAVRLPYARLRGFGPDGRHVALEFAR